MTAITHSPPLNTIDKNVKLPELEPALLAANRSKVRKQSWNSNACFYSLSTNEAEQWREILQRCHTYDVYHLPEYHQLAEEQEAHRAELFVFEQGEALIAIPLLLRSLVGIPGLEESSYMDSTSVYGYSGPVANVKNPDAELLQNFASSLKYFLQSRGIITLFSRLHPLMAEQTAFLQFPGSRIVDVGPTVSIDLTLSPELQQQQMRKDHRYEIRRLRRTDLHCLHDQSWQHFDEFIKIYHETMEHVGASANYFFDHNYFMRLRELLGSRLHLFVVKKDDQVIAGSLFMICNSIIQYHLSGTCSEFRKLSPTKLILDTVRLWGVEMGATQFHLGGGVGAKQDQLFKFKAGFSKQTHPFKVWQLISDMDGYARLLEERRQWNEANGYVAPDARFFPAYRCPIIHLQD